jgi:hypothetical protein
VVIAKVNPFEDGFNGECVVSYGPILVDTEVQKRLGEAIKINYLEVDCDGGSKRSTFRFDLLKIDNYEVQCYDKYHEKLVDTVRITNDLATDPSMIDSLQMRMITPGNGTGLVNWRRDDQDEKPRRPRPADPVPAVPDQEEEQR